MTTTRWVALGLVGVLGAACGQKGGPGKGGAKADAAPVRELAVAAGGVKDPLRATAKDVDALAARGEAGIPGLIAIARAGGHATVRALRALGRDPERGVDELVELIAASAWGDPGQGAGIDPDPDADYWPMATEAVKTVSALVDAPADGEAPSRLGQRIAGTLGLATRSGLPSLRAAAAEGLGRVGLPTSIKALGEALDHSHAEVRAAAAVALGRFGKRGIALTPELHTRLIALAVDPDKDVRYGVAYALAKEATPLPDKKIVAALAGLVKDADAETRSLAIAGLGAHGAYARAAAGLDDPDWRVRVQGVRALSQPKTPAALRSKLAEWLGIEWTSIADSEERLKSARVHVVLEGLERLQPFAKETGAKKLFNELGASTETAASTVKDRYTPELLRPIDAVACLAAAGRARVGGPIEAVKTCGEPSGKGWPLHLRRQLYAGLLGEGVGGAVTQRVLLLKELAEDKDARVRAAAADAAAKIDDAGAQGMLVLAIGDADPGVAGSAADAAGARWPEAAKTKTKEAEVVVPAPVLAAIVTRLGDAKVQADAELYTTLLGALAAVGGPDRTRFLAAAAKDQRAAVRDVAAKHLRKLGVAIPEPPVAQLPTGTPPPGDVAALAGQAVTWVVETTKGKFTLVLDTDAAPVSVAALTALAQKGFYAGLLWHRVVPDFVAQGGDPTGSGWGSAGFTLPSEATGERYVRGAVGIADAGRGTGGCQWFVMHSRAPHLEGRYTWIGRVSEGQDVVDSLLVGDTIVKIDVTIAPRVVAPPPAPQPTTRPTKK